MGGYVDNRGNDKYKYQAYNNYNNPFVSGNPYSCGASVGEQITYTAINCIFGTLTQIGARNESQASVSTPAKQVDATQIESDIQTILNKYDVNAGGELDTVHSDDYTPNISDLQAQIEYKKAKLLELSDKYSNQTSELNTLQSEREGAQKQLEPINKKLEAKNSRLNTVTNELKLKTDKATQLDTKIQNLQNSENASETTIQNEIKKAQDELQKLNEEIKKLQAEQKTLQETEIPALEKEAQPHKDKIAEAEPKIQKLNEEIKPLNELKAEIRTMEEDLAKLKDLQKQLKKANGSDVIETLQNKDTENVTKHVKALREAKNKGDNAQIAKAETDLKNAMTLYYADPENLDSDGTAKNKTIEMLAKSTGYK